MLHLFRNYKRSILKLYFFLYSILFIKYTENIYNEIEIKNYSKFLNMLEKMFNNSSSVKDFIYFFDLNSIPKVNTYKFWFSEEEEFNHPYNIFVIILLIWSRSSLQVKNEEFLIELYDTLVKTYNLDFFSLEKENFTIFYYCNSLFLEKLKEYLLDRNTYKLIEAMNDNYDIL